MRAGRFIHSFILSLTQRCIREVSREKAGRRETGRERRRGPSSRNQIQSLDMGLMPPTHTPPTKQPEPPMS